MRPCPPSRLGVATSIGLATLVTAASAHASQADDRTAVRGRVESPAPTPARKPVSLRIPRVGNTQPWLRYTLFSEYYKQNYDTIRSNDGFVALVNRVNLGTITRLDELSINATVRFDSQNIFHPGGRDCIDGAAGCILLEDDYRLERTTLRFDTRKFGATLGDSNVNFGRGLALSLRKIDEIGVDATIKGGRLDLRTKPVRATAIGGFTNRQNSDFASRQLISDPGYPFGCNPSGADPPYPGAAWDGSVGNPLWTVCSDVVAGGRVEGTLPGKVDVGAHYVFLDFGVNPVPLGDEVIHLAGGDISRTRIANVWDVYVGASGLMRSPHLAETNPADSYSGYAIYGANTLTFGRTTALIETKHYTDYLVAESQNALLQYAEAPTLEREDQQVPGSAEATGGRVRVDHLFREAGVTLFGNVMAYMAAQDRGDARYGQFCPTKDGQRIDTCELVSHGFAGLIWRKPKSDVTLQISGGYRNQYWIERDRVHRRFPHGEFAVSIPTTSAGMFHESITVRAEGRWETYNTLATTDEFFRGLFVLGYNWAPRVLASLLVGVDTAQPTPLDLVSLTDEVCRPGPGSRCRPHLWPGILLRVNLWDASFLRLFVGRQVGGRICVNGSCRVVPDFEGARAELALSF